MAALGQSGGHRGHQRACQLASTPFRLASSRLHWPEQSQAAQTEGHGQGPQLSMPGASRSWRPCLRTAGCGGTRGIFFAMHPAYPSPKPIFCLLPGSPGSLSPRQVGLSLAPPWEPGCGHSPSSDCGPSLGNTDPSPGGTLGRYCESPSPPEGTTGRAGARA